MPATAGGAPDGARPARTHDLTKQEIPATIDVPRGFKGEADITDRGDKIFQIRRGRMLVEVARLYGRCTRAYEEQTLSSLKYSVMKTDDIPDGLVVACSKPPKEKGSFYVKACVAKGDQAAECYSQRLTSEADASAAYDICKSLKYKQP
jgi:hypothetical protein